MLPKHQDIYLHARFPNANNLSNLACYSNARGGLRFQSHLLESEFLDSDSKDFFRRN